MGDRDIMERLPMEMRLHIFSFLDTRSLLACSRVNEGWNEITNYVSPEIWFQACLDAKIFVDRTRYDNAEDWKAFFSSMLQRKNDMQTSECFRQVPYLVLTPLTAIYCNEEKIAMAFISRTIEIRSLPECEFIREFHCDFQPAFLKFDDSILIAGSRYGIIWSWSTKSGIFLRAYSNIERMPTSFDFLTDCDIFVNSFIDCNILMTGIRICRMSDGQVTRNLILQRQSLIYRVMLAQHPDYPVSEEKKACFLFCLAMDCVYTFKVVLEFHTIFYDRVASHLCHDIPFHIQTANDRMYKPLGGLRFDGRILYIMTSSLSSAATHAIWEWDFRSGESVWMQNDDQIVSLLGVGQIYLAYEIKTRENLERILISNKATDEVVATIQMTRRDMLTNDFLSLVKTSWLDGLDGENDSGIISVSIADDKLGINFIEFSPRRE